MSGLPCNYQQKLTRSAYQEALREGACRECFVTQAELLAKGRWLEVCGEEFAYDLETGDRVLVPVPLCPDCHAKAHRDAKGRHSPCQVRARFSREASLVTGL